MRKISSVVRLISYDSQTQAYVYSFIFYLILLTVFIVADTGCLQAQERGVSLSAYNYFFVSQNKAPFWHHANRQGSVREESALNNITGFSVLGPVIELFPGLNMQTGARAINRFSDQTNTLHFQQLYGQIDYGVLSLRAGRFLETMGIHNPDLGTGSMILSHNATPFPKISLETTRFLDLPLTNGRLQFHARFSEGILEEYRFTRSPRVHQKSLYLKVNIANFELIGGILHNVMWGGNSPEHGKLSTTFEDYLRVVFAQPASVESGVPGSGNRLGNTIGAYDFAVIYSLDNIRFLAYRLFYLEDTPAAKFRSPFDGVWGAGFEHKDGSGILTSLTYEHMNTLTQDARSHIPRGRANYYNHYVYMTGWSYYGRGLGNPLLTYDNKKGLFVNNIVAAHHLGIAGRPAGRFSYRLMATYSRNYGICNDRVSPGQCVSITTENPMPDEWELRPRREFRRDRYSALLEGRYLLSDDHRINLIGSLAFDLGEYAAPRTGVMAGIEISY